MANRAGLGENLTPPLPWERLRRLLVATRLIGLAQWVDRTAKRMVFHLGALMELASGLPALGSLAHAIARRLRGRDDRHVGEGEFWRVVGALERAGVGYCIVGGWGLDSLLGCETRRHGDVDVLVDDFVKGLPIVARALADLGYRRELPLGGTPWFPCAEVFEDRSNHRVEVLSLGAAACDEAVARGLIGSAERDVLLDPGQAGGWPSSILTPGSIGGRPVRTISEGWQALFHSGYAGRPEDAHAEALLGLLRHRRSSQSEPDAPLVTNMPSGGREPESLLLIPVFSFPTELWRLCRLYRNDLNLVPPHVTLAFPFLPLREVTNRVVGQLRRFFGGVQPFDFSLADIRWFDSEVVYLAPDPPEPFIALTERLQEMFPAFRPYGGEFDSVVPHVTLSRHGNAGDRQIVGRYAPRYLPLDARASHCWLMADHRGADEWSIVEVFEFALSSQTRTE